MNISANAEHLIMSSKVTGLKLTFLHEMARKVFFFFFFPEVLSTLAIPAGID